MIPAAAAPSSETEAPAASLAGQLLIASAEIQDPRFAHAVILVLRHDRTGAFGIMINRPLDNRPIAGLLAAIGDRNTAGIAGSISVLAGGPVQPQSGFVIHSGDYRGDHTLVVDAQISMTANADILRDIGHGKGPARHFFAIGYTGWGPGQLDAEIAGHGWFSAPDDPALIFDDDRGEIWKRALSQRLHEL